MLRHSQAVANSTEDFPIPGLHVPVSSEPLEGFGGRKAVLSLSLMASVAAALFVCAHWSIALVGAVVVLVLSAMESEAFLLFVILLTPFVWVLQGDVLVRNVSVTLRCLVVVGFFAGRLLRGRAGIKHLFRPAMSRASLLFLCAAVASTILGKEGLTYESVRALYQMATFVGFYFVVLAWVDSRQRYRKVLSALLCSTVVTAVFAFYQQIIGGYTSLWLYLIPQDEYSPPWSGRSTSFMGHPNNFAGYLNLVLPFALACYALGRGKWKKLGGWTLGLGFLGLVSSQSLGGLAAFVSILVLAIFCFARSRKKRLVLLAGLCALVCLFYLLRPVLDPTHTEEIIGSDTVTRLLLWGTAWDEFIHSPVFGVGWGNFAAPYGGEIPLVRGVSEPHNIYFQLLAETGLVGLVAFFNLVIKSWRQARRQLRSSLDFLDLALAFGVLGALLSLMVHGFIDIPFFAQSGTLLWVLLALLVASDRLQRKIAGGPLPGER
ncbi:MAG: O-antigen ligase family protein [Terriglobia bacterium]